MEDQKLAQARALMEQALALLDSTDARATAAVLQSALDELQAEQARQGKVRA